ncbi:zinc finger protein 709 isoform X3 [Aedes aegypti]|uniref:C2H2-type domain-containing protein n=1 Tax=Aedes aegypti TaxID=7159 RepID=A0A6I8TYD0_AEDAE|nr:zinc finger protein 709 isoform X3 [Aedes aegypti]
MQNCVLAVTLAASEDENHPGRKSNVSCEFCGKVFKFRATLKQHEQIHYGIKAFECEICNRRFLHKGTLKVHLRMHTGEMPYQCPHCPKQFRGQTALDCHIFRHTKQGTKCPQCSSIFATPSIVKQHIREVHTTERVNTCQICGITYKHLKSLRLHLRNHQKRVCPDCGKIFHSVYAMMTHRKIHAQDHFQFNCGYCDRKFEKEDELVAHGKLRGRTYQCEMCCHSFNKADYLDNHNRRNHWKELGLEQLKIAPPKNGWNRKGVPKPKRKGFEEDGGEVTLEMEPLEVAYNVNVPPISETYIDYVEAPQPETSYTEYSVPQDPQLDVESLCQIAKNECDSDFKTNSLEVEHILPDETPHGVVQQEYRLESDHDYVGDDFHYEDDSVKDDVPDEDDEELKTEIKNEPEVIQDSPMVCPVPTEVPTEPDKDSIVDAVPKLEDPEQKEEIEKVAEVADVGSDTDDDDKPLSTWLPERQRSTPQKSLSSNVDEQTTVFIKKESNQEEAPEDVVGQPKKSPMVTVIEHQKPLKRKRISKIADDLTRVRQQICLFCGESFKGRLALKKHKKTVHPDLTPHKGPFICEICGKTCANVTSLVCHRNRHDEYQRFKCDECPKAFAFRCYLETHKRAEHLHERLICPLCGKQFKYSQDLKVHTRQHEDDKPFKCDQCPSTFRYPSALRSHKARHEQTVFTCDICSKTFKYDNSLRVHKRLHSGVKQYRCKICDREFNTKAPLVRHLATHSVEREVKCVVCDKIFYKKVDLVIHQSKEHPNDPIIGKTVKIHKCEVCGQEFAKKSNMKAHSYIHGDVYKFKCKLCDDQQFKQHAGLRHHLIHFHKMDLSKKKSEGESEKKEAEGQQDQQSSTTVDATLTPAITIVHEGVEFMVQHVQCERFRLPSLPKAIRNESST